MRGFTGDAKRDAHIHQALRAREEELVERARKLASSLAATFEQEEEKSLSEKEHKEQQLRNIQAIAEQSPSWAPVELFIRYQAARRMIYPSWAEEANQSLADLRKEAESIVGTKEPRVIDDLHMELVRRVLGYTVRWHVWHAKGETRLTGGKG